MRYLNDSVTYIIKFNHNQKLKFDKISDVLDRNIDKSNWLRIKKSWFNLSHLISIECGSANDNSKDYGRILIKMNGISEFKISYSIKEIDDYKLTEEEIKELCN